MIVVLLGTVGLSRGVRGAIVELYVLESVLVVLVM